jgi:hypothetical protein
MPRQGYRFAGNVSASATIQTPAPAPDHPPSLPYYAAVAPAIPHRFWGIAAAVAIGRSSARSHNPIPVRQSHTESLPICFTIQPPENTTFRRTGLPGWPMARVYRSRDLRKKATLGPRNRFSHRTTSGQS